MTTSRTASARLAIVPVKVSAPWPILALAAACVVAGWTVLNIVVWILSHSD